MKRIFDSILVAVAFVVISIVAVSCGAGTDGGKAKK